MDLVKAKGFKIRNEKIELLYTIDIVYFEHAFKKGSTVGYC